MVKKSINFLKVRDGDDREPSFHLGFSQHGLSNPMKTALLAGFFTLSASLGSPASAALSGFFDAAEQVQAIMSSTDVSSAMKEMPFDTLEQVRTRDNGDVEWRVQNSECYVIATLKPIPPEALGKTTYEVVGVSACEGSDEEDPAE